MSVTVHGVAALPDASYKRRASTEGIVIHCAQTNAHQNFGVEDIRGWHQKENGWIDVGYNYVIRRDGIVQRGRPKWAVGAHVAGYNHNTVGVCLVGGCDEQGREQNNFTPAQWAVLPELLHDLTVVFPDVEDIRGHRDFPNVHKYCPSFDVATWLRSVGLAR